MEESTRLRMLLKTVAQESATLRLLGLDRAAVARRFGLTVQELDALHSADLLRVSDLVASRSRGAPDPRELGSPVLGGAHAALTPSPPPPPTGVLVVNMTPQALSGESEQDSEPWLTINPANAQQMVATAFTPNPAGSGNAPVYVSSDGGTTWALNAIVPSQVMTADITVAFSGAGNLYAGIIVVPIADKTPRVQILRTTNAAGSATMDVLFDLMGKGVDQPRTMATTVGGKDRVYVGANDFNGSPATATVFLSSDAAATTPAFSTVRLETRTTAGQDAPTVLPAVATDGNTIYVAYFHWSAVDNSTNDITADVVVARDDAGGTGASPFQALVDSDGKAGIRAAQGITTNLDNTLGPQPERVGSDLSIAVDPSNNANVYLAYGAIDPAGYTLHLRRSTDSGKTWSGDLKTLVNAFGPSLAVNSDGVLGFLYQQLTGAAGSERWNIHLERSSDMTNWTDRILASPPATAPTAKGQPYLGDYQRVQTVGKDFYGVFCANNTPDLNNFPSGVRYQRNANFTTHTLLPTAGSTPVDVSIDPFFFKVNG